jgi:serine/threonine protein phosphatase PrpC
MWRTFGAAVTGSSHVASGADCQDAFGFWNLTDETVVLAVADGAGSASQAAVASKAAVAEAIGFCRSAFEIRVEPDQWEAVLAGAVNAARDFLLLIAAEQGCAPRDLATTLQLVLASSEGLAYLRIGDGCCVILDEGQIRAVGPRPINEYVNETEFLTTEAPTRSVSVERRSMKGVALFTDGLQNVAMHLADWRPYEPFFHPLFAFAASGPSEVAAVEAVTRLLSRPAIESRTDDDRTLLLSVWEHDGQ